MLCIKLDIDYQTDMKIPAKIVSGGQTGVDRGALDAALDTETACGGWCPAGRLAEDGPIPQKYPLQELPASDYADRTRQNVIDSDATVIIHFGKISGGTYLTQQFCQKFKKPHLIIDAEQASPREAAQQIAIFCKSQAIKTLNVAGPRASRAPQAHNYAYQTFLLLATG
jgi:hypothetical protein